ncbi:GNAT family N-acetyltransferase [Candidatus Dependentiae bacterium]
MEYTISLAKKEDALDIFNLSNDSDVRKNSFNSKKIIWQDHIKWFVNKIISYNCIYFVVRNTSNEFIGQIRFDKFEEEESTYIISISLHGNFRGKGLGSKLLRQSSDKIIDDFGVKKIYAYIKDTNQPSIKVFEKSNYSVIGNKIDEKINFLKLQYCKS